MKVVETTVRQMEISEVSGLDPIRVILNDLEPHKGRINIECWGKAWSAYWGAMGDNTLAEFFLSCDEHYLAKNLSNIECSVFDQDGLVELLRKSVIKDRRLLILNKDEARDKFDEIDSLPDIEDPWGHATTLQHLLGDEWWYLLPTKTNPEYDYLCRIINTVKDALKSRLPF